MNLQNKSIVLNVVLAIAVVVLGVRLVSGAEDAGESQTQEQAVLDNIATRTSIRDYEARPVEKEKVEKMLLGDGCTYGDEQAAVALRGCRTAQRARQSGGCQS